MLKITSTESKFKGKQERRKEGSIATESPCRSAAYIGDAYDHPWLGLDKDISGLVPS